MKSYRLSLCIFIALIFLSACASRKKLKSPELASEPIALDSIYKNIFHQPKPDWFSGKARISVHENNDQSKALMYLRMRSDSVIWTVYKKLSVEAARSQITPDSFFIIYRLEKKYDARALDSMGHIYGFDAEYGFMEDMIAGRLPALDTSKLWKEKEDDQNYSFRSMHKDLVIDFNYNKRTGLLDSGRFYDRFGRTGSWKYSDYRMINGLPLPFIREFHIKFANQDSLGLKMDFMEIETGVPHDIRFSIPEHYQKIN